MCLRSRDTVAGPKTWSGDVSLSSAKGDRTCMNMSMDVCIHLNCRVMYVLYYSAAHSNLPQVFEESDCDGSGMIDFEEFR
jgi:hypothetical protein